MLPKEVIRILKNTMARTLRKLEGSGRTGTKRGPAVAPKSVKRGSRRKS